MVIRVAHAGILVAASSIIVATTLSGALIVAALVAISPVLLGVVVGGHIAVAVLEVASLWHGLLSTPCTILTGRARTVSVIGTARVLIGIVIVVVRASRARTSPSTRLHVSTTLMPAAVGTVVLASRMATMILLLVLHLSLALSLVQLGLLFSEYLFLFLQLLPQSREVTLLIVLNHRVANGPSSLLLGDLDRMFRPRYGDVELVAVVDRARLDLREIHVVLVQIDVVEVRDLDFHRFHRRRRILLFPGDVFRARALLLLRSLFLLNRHLHVVGLWLIRVAKAAKLMGQHEVEPLVLAESILLVVLQISPLRQLLHASDSCKDFSRVIAPGLFVEAIVEVLIHVGLIVVVPGLRLTLKVKLVDLGKREGVSPLVFILLLCGCSVSWISGRSVRSISLRGCAIRRLRGLIEGIGDAFVSDLLPITLSQLLIVCTSSWLRRVLLLRTTSIFSLVILFTILLLYGIALIVLRRLRRRSICSAVLVLRIWLLLLSKRLLF